MKLEKEKKSQAQKIAKILTYIGGTLIFFGVCYLLFNNWNILAVLSRILLTLGVAVWSLLFAVSLARQEKNSNSSAVFFTIGGLLLPLGISVTLDALGMPTGLDISKIIVTGICFSVFLGLQWRYPREILLLFCLFFGSTFFMATTNYLNNQMGLVAPQHLFDYQLFALGLGYLLAGYSISFKNENLTGLLYFIGDLLALVSSFSLAGLLFENNFSIAWQVIAPITVLLSFILSINLKSKVLMYLGALFLIIYITNLTRQFAYLFGTLGWPVVLIGAGLFLMLLGFIFMNLHKKNPKE